MYASKLKRMLTAGWVLSLDRTTGKDAEWSEVVRGRDVGGGGAGEGWTGGS